MDANQLRSTFTDFYAARGHVVVPSASLIPHDPTVLFTIAGMVPFKPYFLGEQTPPWPRATSVQKCFRTNDIEIIGTTTRQCVVERDALVAAQLPLLARAMPFIGHSATRARGSPGSSRRLGKGRHKQFTRHARECGHPVLRFAAVRAGGADVGGYWIARFRGQ